MIQFINTIIILGLFALCIDGKHMQQQSTPSIVSKYAAMPAEPNVMAGLTEQERTMLGALARHMGRK